MTARPHDALFKAAFEHLCERRVGWRRWVSTDLHFQQFREMIHERLTETQETAMTIAEELIQQGRMEGRALVRLLVQRFGSVPERYRERFAAATDERFDRFCRRMFEVETLEAVFDD